MISPSALGFGSVAVEITFAGQEYGVKIYPRMVHALKASGKKLAGPPPRTISGYKTRCQNILQLRGFLAGLDPMDVGGFRIEVSVSASSLAEAKRQVEATPLLDHTFWLEPPPERTLYRLEAKLVAQQVWSRTADGCTTWQMSVNS